MARFSDRATTPARGPLDILKWRFGARPAEDPGGFVTPRVDSDGSAIATLPSSLTWIGHATFVLRLGGKTIAIDPIWSEKISGVVPRRAAPGVALENVPSIDVVLVTHNHRDHMDVPTLEKIGPTAQYVVPLGNARLLHKVGLTNTIELDWWQSHTVDAVTITLVPARHWSMRFPWDRNDMLWGGYVISGPEGRAYHSGDTALFDGFTEIGERCGPIDWAMLPIGAYEPRWFMEPQHMNPEDALIAFERLGAKTFVAMHWGTFKLTDESIAEPPEKTRALWAERGWDEARLQIPAIGETLRLVR